MEKPKLFAFVLMPFDPSFDDTYKLGIKEAVSQFDDMFAERVDEQMYREVILERIYRQIEIADIIIADMTDQNPNVFYEVTRFPSMSTLMKWPFDNDKTCPTKGQRSPTKNWPTS